MKLRPAPLRTGCTLANACAHGYDAGMTTYDFLDMDAIASHYPAHVATIRDRHDRALERAGAAHAVIFSGAPLPVFLDDYDYPFKANPHFVGWLPLTDLPHCYVVYTPGDKPLLIYYQEKDYWHLPPAAPEGFWSSQFDVRVIHDHADAERYLPDDRDNCILIGEITDEAQAFGIDRVNPGTAINMLHYERAVKTDYELDCMRAASRRGVKGHRAAEKAFRAGMSEFDIHLAYLKAVGHAENDLPYGNIIALNEHGAVLHYQHQSAEMPDQHRSFLIDAGARVNGYASDITRTYAYEDDEFARLIDRFDVLQRELVSEVREGVGFADLHLSCHRKIAELLIETELATGGVEALLETGVTAAFYPHGLGHLLGVQVHDVGGHMADDTGTVAEPPSEHPFLRTTRTLENDQVVTIEPGLYVIDLLLEGLSGTPGHDLLNSSRIDWLRPYGGIRIEDDVRVDGDGCENLTRDAFGA